MRINVTTEHIKTSEAMKHHHQLCVCCPIALALQEAFKKELSVTVNHGDAVYRFEDTREYHKLPPECLAFIRAFDSFNNAEPFTFEVQP